MKESIKTVLLWGLSILLIFMVAEIWIQIPSITKETQKQENFEKNRLKMELLGPKELLLSFSDTEQTLVYDIQPYWTMMQMGLKDLYENAEARDVSPMKAEDYRKFLQEGQVLSLNFSGILDHGNWAQLLQLDLGTLPKKIPGKLLSMDLSLNRDLLMIRTDRGAFLVRSHLRTRDLLKDRVSMVYDSRRYRNYTSLWKKYGVANMVYIPRINTQAPEDIPLENKLQTMSGQVQNNLARRYLRQNIDYIREIVEDQAVTYVYDQKVLRLNKNGWLTYKDGQKNSDQEDSLVQSLDAALDFITSHTGMTGSLYISKSERIQDRDNPGYIFYFNMLANHKRVYRMDQAPYLARLEVHGQDISQMDFLYQKPMEREIVQNVEIAKEVLSPEEIIDQNLSLLDPESKSLEETLGQLKWIDSAYVELDPPGGQRVLRAAWAIKIKDRIFLMDMETGSLIMEG